MKAFTLPLPPPSPRLFVGVSLLVALSGCFQSTLPGQLSAAERPVPPQPPDIPDEPLGPSIAMREFVRIGVEGRCIADEWRLSLEGDGSARAEIATGRRVLATGSVTDIADGYHVALDTDPAFDLVETDDVWNGYTLWHIFEEEGGLADWAVELPPREEAPAGLPSLRACASFEQWSLHDISDGVVSPSHTEVVGGVEPETWYGAESEYPLWLDIGEDGSFQYHDARLPLRDDGQQNGTIFGEVIRWDGTEGVARVRSSIGVCSAAEGLVTFWFVRDELHVMQEWYVVDVDDLDDDGDRQERHLRRTRSVLTEAACPRSLWR